MVVSDKPSHARYTFTGKRNAEAAPLVGLLNLPVVTKLSHRMESPPCIEGLHAVIFLVILADNGAILDAALVALLSGRRLQAAHSALETFTPSSDRRNSHTSHFPTS